MGAPGRRSYGFFASALTKAGFCLPVSLGPLCRYGPGTDGPCGPLRHRPRYAAYWTADTLRGRTLISTVRTWKDGFGQDRSSDHHAARGWSTAILCRSGPTDRPVENTLLATRPGA